MNGILTCGKRGSLFARCRWFATALLFLIAGYAAPVLALTYTYCSPYQGNSTVGGTSASGNTTGYIATINEYYFGNAANFAEIQITGLNGDGKSAAPSSVWSNWSMAVTYKSGSSFATITAPLNQVSVTACYEGQVTYFWIPSAAFTGAPASLPFASSSTNQIMLLDSSGNDIDMLAGQSTGTITLWPSINVCSQLTTLNGSVYGNPYQTETLLGSLGNKDIVRVPNATGAWAISGASNGPAASGTTPVVSGSSVTGTIAACSVSPNNGGIAVSKTVTTTPSTGLTPGATVGFSVKVKNQTTTAQAVTVTDTLPAGMTYVAGSAVSTPAGTLTSFPPTWVTPSLAAVGSATLTFNATVNSNVPDGSSLTNTASAPLPSSTLTATSSAGVTNIVNPLTMTKTVDNATPSVGQTVTFTVTVTNKQNPGPTSITVSDTFPSGLTWTVTPSVGSTYSAGVWTITGIGDAPLAGQTTATLTATATVPSGATGTYTNTAQITAVSPAEPNLALPLSAAASFTVALPVSTFDACETGCSVGASNWNRLYTKHANVAYNFDIVAVGSGGLIASGFTGPSGQVTSVALLAYTAVQPASPACPAAGADATISLSNLQFTNGRAAQSVPVNTLGAYRDVRVKVVYNSQSYCSTDRFASRPSAATISTSASATPASSSATPTVIAGAAFTVQAATSPTSYTQTLALDLNQLTAQDPAQGTVQPGGAVGALTLTSLQANGAATGNATYKEVGYLYPGAGAFRDDTWTTVDQNVPSGCSGTTCDCISLTSDSNGNGVPDYLDDAPLNGRYGCSIGNKAAVSFGRFIPDHFSVSSGSFTNRTDIAACFASTLTYTGETLTATFSLTPQSTQSSGGATTQNYRANFGRLNLTTPASFGFLGASSATSAVALDTTNYTIATSGSWSSSGAVVTATNIAAARSSPHAPYTSFQLGIAPVDPDSVAMGSFDLDLVTPPGNEHKSIGATTEIRFGRLWLGNAYGSDKLDLVIPFESQYWNGSAFVKNTSDSCTTLASGNIALGNQQGGLLNPTLYTGPIAVSVTSNGAGSITLTKPSSAAAGSVDLVANLGSSGSPSNCPSLPYGTSTSAALSYLSGKWCGSNYDRDPTARATFGIYGSSLKKGPIYIRESY